MPQFKAFGIECERLNTASIYGNSEAAVHDEALDLLRQGYYLIACMGKGTWTSSGHYVVVWRQDGKVRINDPISKSDVRINGDIQTFRSQVKYYWAIDARKHNEVIPMKEITVEEAKKIVKEKAGLSDSTIQYISDDYRWGNELIIKLAKAMM